MFEIKGVKELKQLQTSTFLAQQAIKATDKTTNQLTTQNRRHGLTNTKSPSRLHAGSSQTVSSVAHITSPNSHPCSENTYLRINVSK